LLKAARKANWRAQHPYTSVIKRLEHPVGEDSTIRVSVQFLYELYQEAILPERRDTLVINLLMTLVNRRNQERVLEKLTSLIINRFKLLPIEQLQLLSLIDAWEKAQTIKFI
jgi:hypothetical protein